MLKDGNYNYVSRFESYFGDLLELNTEGDLHLGVYFSYYDFVD